MYNNNIRKIREERKMTLQELSKKAGISAGYLCHLEKGRRKNPSTEIMDRIAEVLEESISELFFN